MKEWSLKTNPNEVLFISPIDLVKDKAYNVTLNPCAPMDDRVKRITDKQGKILFEQEHINVEDI